MFSILPLIRLQFSVVPLQPKPEQETNSPVELRSSASQGRVGLKRASVSSRDSGFGGSLRDSNASMGNRPSDSSGSTGTVIPSEGGRGIRRNDSGYYSVPDQSPSASRGEKGFVINYFFYILIFYTNIFHVNDFRWTTHLRLCEWLSNTPFKEYI